MIIKRSLIGNTKFSNTAICEDYFFKCQILRRNVVAYKFNKASAFYRILKESRSSQRFQNILYLWKINQKYNKFSPLKNLFSIFMISVNSLIKYGFK